MSVLEVGSTVLPGNITRSPFEGMRGVNRQSDLNGIMFRPDITGILVLHLRRLCLKQRCNEQPGLIIQSFPESLRSRRSSFRTAIVTISFDAMLTASAIGKAQWATFQYVESVNDKW